MIGAIDLASRIAGIAMRGATGGMNTQGSDRRSIARDQQRYERAVPRWCMGGGAAAASGVRLDCPKENHANLRDGETRLGDFPAETR
jgi:hypothetical protein